MTDQQYQPGQTNPPTQGGGVFGGTAQEINKPVSLNDLQNNNQSAASAPVVAPAQTPVVAPIQTPQIPPQATPVPPVTPPAPEAPQAGNSNQATVHKEGKDDLQIGVRDEGQNLPEIQLSTYDGFLFPKPASKEELAAKAAAKENMLADKEGEPVVTEPAAKQAQAPTVQAPEAVVAETKNDIVSPTPQHIPRVPEHNEPQHPGEKLSDVQQKFSSLLQIISELTGLLNIKDGVVEVIGANNDKVSVSYQFEINDKKQIFVKKVESDKEDDNKTIFNELKLLVNPESKFFEIYLDDMMLFEEPELHDTKKKFQVMEKLNKLVFLAEGKLKDIQKELRAKQEELEERKKLQDIFRNF